MSLLNNLYTVQPVEDEFQIRFCASHSIFAGHFPGHPIVPGAILVQIAEELVSSTIGKALHTQTIRNLKFRKAITPDMQVRFSLIPHDSNTYLIDIHDINNQYAQFSATYLCADSNV